MSYLLFLMRHAQSADKQLGQSDKERELTTLGLRQALHIGTQLKDLNFFPDTIISSPATRAKRTSELVAESSLYDLDKIIFDDELYQASVRTFLSQIHRFDEVSKNILCVGHNPTISYLAEYLTKAEIGDLPPAGLVVLKFSQPWSKVNDGNGEFIKLLTSEIQ
jgi:phosphohistidine phosphatase